MVLVRFKPVIRGKEAVVSFSDVVHVPDLRSNLLSVLFLTCHCGYRVVIDGACMEFIKDGVTRFTATIDANNTAYLDGMTLHVPECANKVSTLPLDISLWHRRLGHHNFVDVKKMIKNEMVTGARLDSTSSPDPVCEPCLAGKMHADPFPSSEHRATRPLELVHSDLHGPIRVQTHSGYRYWATFIDDHTRFWVIYLLKKKSDTLAAFKSFKAYAENHFGIKIGTLREDM